MDSYIFYTSIAIEPQNNKSGGWSFICVNSQKELLFSMNGGSECTSEDKLLLYSFYTALKWFYDLQEKNLSITIYLPFLKKIEQLLSQKSNELIDKIKKLLDKIEIEQKNKINKKENRNNEFQRWTLLLAKQGIEATKSSHYTIGYADEIDLILEERFECE